MWVMGHTKRVKFTSKTSTDQKKTTITIAVSSQIEKSHQFHIMR